MVTLSTWFFLKAFVDDRCWKLNSVQVNDLTVNDQPNLRPCSLSSNPAARIVPHFFDRYRAPFLSIGYDILRKFP